LYTSSADGPAGLPDNLFTLQQHKRMIEFPQIKKYWYPQELCCLQLRDSEL